MAVSTGDAIFLLKEEEDGFGIAVGNTQIVDHVREHLVAQPALGCFLDDCFARQRAHEDIWCRAVVACSFRLLAGLETSRIADL